VKESVEVLEAHTIAIVGLNSDKNCRHIPHGADGSRVGVYTAKAAIATSPLATA